MFRIAKLYSLSFTLGCVGVLAAPAGAAAPSRTYGSLPISFEANRGQAQAPVNFLARGAGYGLQLKPQGAVFTFADAVKHEAFTPSKSGASFREKDPVKASISVLNMALENANPDAQSGGEQILPGKVNYFTSKDPAKWRTDIPTYARVRYSDVYPGTDLVYYGSQRQMEYDFVLKPHAEPKSIRFAVTGARKMSVNGAGDLVIAVGGRTIVWRKPVFYQGAGASRTKIEGGYTLTAGNRVGFSIGAYDRSRALVIDPMLTYSTYLGIDYQDNSQRMPIAVDRNGCAYLTGGAIPPDGPKPPDGAQNAFVYDNIFVKKLNADGTALIYTDYIGTPMQDEAYAIKVDASGDACVAGYTQSPDFPTTQGAFGANYHASGGVVFKLNAAGDQFIYSTYLGAGASGSGLPHGLALDTAGNAYVTGFASNGAYPVTSGAFQKVSAGGLDAFLTVLNAAGTGMIYSTLIGGAENDLGSDVAISHDGYVFVTGMSYNYNGTSRFPTSATAFQKQHAGSLSAFLCKLDVKQSGANSLVYSTLLGGPSYVTNGNTIPGTAEGMAVAVDDLDNAYVTGTASKGLPVTSSAYQSTTVGGSAFLSKFSPDGSHLLYSTYLDGRYSDVGYGVAVSGAGVACVVGTTTSPNYLVTVDAYQYDFAGGASDGFLTKIDTSKSGMASLVFSTYFGGLYEDRFYSIALDSKGDAYISGVTNAYVTTTLGAYRTNRQFPGTSPWDEFVTKFNMSAMHGPATLTSISPARIAPTSAKTAVYFTGVNFSHNAVVTINDMYTVPANVSSNTQLAVFLPDAVTSTTGQYYVRVVNPGAPYSNLVRLTIQNPAPIIGDASPSSVPVGLTSVALNIVSQGITADTRVTFSSGPLLVPTSVTGNRLIVSVPAAVLARLGSYVVRLVNPVASGGASDPITFSVVPGPTLTAITPATVKASTTSIVVTLTGSNFRSDSLVKVGDTTAFRSVDSPTKMTVYLPAAVGSTPGTYLIKIVNPGYVNTSQTLRLNVTPAQ